MTIQTMPELANPILSYPVVREIPADLETPVSIYLKLAGSEPSFMLESVTGGEQVARYSFIGINPRRAFVVRGQNFETHERGEVSIRQAEDPLRELEVELARLGRMEIPGLPRFAGGLVGYLGYEMVQFFEPGIHLDRHPDLPDAIFMLADTVIAFDHAFGRMLLIAIPDHERDGERALEQAELRLDELQARLANQVPAQEARKENPAQARAAGEMRSNMSRENFMQAVRQAREYIAAGDIFQVVLSQKLSRETDAPAFEIYRALRRLNPSPYMFFFNFGQLAGDPPLFLIGASPEMHVRLTGRTATIRPIAGTRPRGKTPQDDARNEVDLLADPKERAEHVMLVDLARNDLGRVSDYGSVNVPERMVIERYSHVMHIVSQVEGRLRPGFSAFDLMRATFPAGTVSGAPKVRAMQIIDELEGSSRGPYAGAVGYFGADGSMDTCITIRTLTMRGKTVTVQAGAGIVADSDPASEYQETLNKARALAVAIDQADKQEA